MAALNENHRISQEDRQARRTTQRIKNEQRKKYGDLGEHASIQNDLKVDVKEVLRY